jgi:hypothetical protein
MDEIVPVRRRMTLTRINGVAIRCASGRGFVWPRWRQLVMYSHKACSQGFHPQTIHATIAGGLVSLDDLDQGP